MDNSLTNEFDINIEKAKSNNDTLLINNKYIHSKFYPEKEASDFKFEGKHLIIIFGAGLYYHVNNIIKNNPQSLFIIYDPIKNIHELSSKYFDNSLYNNYKEKICILDTLDFYKVRKFLSANQFKPNLRLLTYSNPGYKNLFRSIEENFFNLIKKTIEYFTQNLLTENKFIPLWTRNFLYNITSLDRIPLVIPQKRDLGDNIAIIVCAGPNLINDLDIIKKYRDRITIFAVDTAIKTLLASNINPDFILSLDGQFYSLNDFTRAISDESVLVLDTVTYPGIKRYFKNVYQFSTLNFFDNTICEFFYKYVKINKFGISTGGTVADYTLEFVKLFGFKNIYFSGLDLCFPYLQTHALETPFYSDLLSTSNYFKTLRGEYSKVISQRHLKRAVSRQKNREVLTDFVLQNYASYIGEKADIYKDLKIYYGPHYSLKIQNINEIELERLIENSISIRQKPDLLIDIDNLKYAINDQIMDFINYLELSLFNDSKKLSLIINELAKIKENSLIDLKTKKYFKDLFTKYPFLEGFIIMTEIILNNKNINDENLLWYKHIGHKCLQSVYYIIRVLKKAKVFLQIK